MKLACSVTLALGCLLPAILLADSTTVTGNDTNSLTGSTSFFAYNNALSNSLSSYGFSGSTFQTSGFSITLASFAPLAGTLSNASLTLNSLGGSAFASNGGQSVSPVNPGYFYTYSCNCGCFCGSWSCSFCCLSTCQAFQPYSYSAALPNILAFFGGQYTSIQAGANTVNIAQNGGTLDLIALGFANEIMAGDSFTISGYRSVGFGLNGFSTTGSNAYTNYSNVNATNNDVATAELDAATVPEPTSILLLATMVIGIAVMCRRVLATR